MGGVRRRLLRDVIGSSLAGAEGYFTKKDVINYKGGRRLDFTRILGESHYRSEVGEAYRKGKRGSWMTPCEIFSPLYSQALASYMLKELKKRGGDQLVCIEIGGGSGTNAREILDYVRQVDPELYKRTEYSLIEVSPKLQELQRERVCSRHANAKVINADATKWHSAQDERPCFVLALEVLDNLPHDKVQIGPEGDLYEAFVEGDGLAQKEQFRPVSDKVIQEILAACPEYTASLKEFPQSTSLLDQLGVFFGSKVDYSAAFLPTATFQVFCRLRENCPNHRIIAADFDSFPPPLLKPSEELQSELVALGAPLVSSISPTSKDGVADQPTYLVPQGSADIFFPTDFQLLSKLYQNVCGRRALHMTQKDFLSPHVNHRLATTISGYCPILDDFSNMKVLIS